MPDAAAKLPASACSELMLAQILAGRTRPVRAARHRALQLGA
jgi:hypothetical protein